MRIDRRAEFLRQRRDFPQAAFARRVFRVEPELVRDERAEMVIRLMVAAKLLGAARKIIDTAAQHDAEPRLGARLGHLFREHVHVKCRRDAAREVFENRQARQRPDVRGRELRLHRENLFIEPFVERQVVGQRPQKGHRRMRVRVFKAGHQDVARRVDRAVKRLVGRLRGTGVLDFPVADPQFAGQELERLLHRQDACILETNIQRNSPFEPIAWVFFLFYHKSNEIARVLMKISGLFSGGERRKPGTQKGIDTFAARAYNKNKKRKTHKCWEREK